MRNERGNVLFFILLGVALFAGLSFAVTQSSRTGPGTVDKERAALWASEFIQYGTAMEQGVSRMIISKNVPDYGLDFVDASTRNTTANGTCTSDKCKVFKPTGGGIQGRDMPQQAYDPAFNLAYTAGSIGKMSPRAVGVTGVGSSDNDLAAVWFGIKDDVCKEINRKLGVPNWQTIPSATASSVYSGTYTAYPSGGIISNTELVGKRAFCAYHSTGWGNYYYHMLWAR